MLYGLIGLEFESSEAMNFSVGDKVLINAPLSYLKTVDSRPMLRPPDLVALNEVGLIVGIRAKDLAEVSFRKGKFLIPLDRLSHYGH